MQSGREIVNVSTFAGGRVVETKSIRLIAGGQSALQVLQPGPRHASRSVRSCCVAYLNMVCDSAKPLRRTHCHCTPCFDQEDTLLQPKSRMTIENTEYLRGRVSRENAAEGLMGTRKIFSGNMRLSGCVFRA